VTRGKVDCGHQVRIWSSECTALGAEWNYAASAAVFASLVAVTQVQSFEGPLSGNSVEALHSVLVHQQELAVVHRLHQTHNVIKISMLASCFHSKPRRPGTVGVA